MAKSKEDDELIMLSNHDNYTVMLTHLRRVNIEGISKQKNNRMLAYFDLLVDDLLIYNGDFELDVEISMSPNDMFMSIMLEKSYPYYEDCIFLCFDLKEKASIQSLARALSNIDTDDREHWDDKDDIVKYIDCSFGYDHELMLSDYPPMTIEYGCGLMRNVRLVDKALYFENQLVKTFHDNNIHTGNDIRIDSSSFTFTMQGTREPDIFVNSAYLDIRIENDGVKFTFDKDNTFTFTTTTNFERDFNMLQMFIKMFIEKKKDHDIHDLKSELLLIEMETI